MSNEIGNTIALMLKDYPSLRPFCINALTKKLQKISMEAKNRMSRQFLLQDENEKG